MDFSIFRLPPWLGESDSGSSETLETGESDLEEIPHFGESSQGLVLLISFYSN